MARKRSHECTNCGAPLDIPTHHDRYFRCASCGSVLEDSASPTDRAAGDFSIHLAAPTSVDVSQLTTYAGTAKKVASGFVIFMFVFVVGFIGVVGFVIFQAFDSFNEGSNRGGSGGDAVATADGSTVEITNYAAAAVVDSDDATGRDLVGFARGPDGDRIVYIDFDASPAARWSVDPGIESDVFAQFVATEDLVVVGAAKQVTAYNRDSGAEAWSVVLSDAVQPNICTDCFVRFGDALVTLTSDGVLSAHDLSNGSQLWTKTLAETPRQIANFGGSPAVLDDFDGTVSLHVFALASGEVTSRLPLSCVNQTFGDRTPIGIFEGVFPVGESSIVHIGDQAFGPCVQLWDPPGPDPTFEALYEAPFSVGPELDEVLIADDLLFVVAKQRADVIDLTKRTSRALLEVPDAELSPVAVDDEVLVIGVESTRGTGSAELQAVDIETGNVKWTFDLESTEQLVPGGSGIVARDVWAADLTSAGLSVLQYRSEADEIVLQNIPLASGTASAVTSFDLSGYGFSAKPSILGWTGDTLHVLVDGTALEIDATKATITHEVP